MAAALPIGPLCHSKHNPPLQLRKRNNSRMSAIVCCQNRDPKIDKENKEGSRSGKFWIGMEKLGKELRENLSPRRKGDWKDVTLMSLSFAVYIYMSQKLVCAYCLWMSMSSQPW